MAVTFIPSFTGGKIASSAERKVFDILKNFRMNAFVFHSVGLPRHEKKAYGEEVREVVYDGETSFKNEIEKILKNLETGGVNAGDVVFLSHKRYKNSILSKVGIAVEESCNDDMPGLPKFSTIHSFKGLDSKVVILCDLEEIPEENYQKFVYIAATRARTLLYVTGSRDFFKKIGK